MILSLILLLLAPAMSRPPPPETTMTDFLIENAEEFRKVVPVGSRVRAVADGFRFTEGPVWTGAELVFSDEPVDSLFAWSPAGGVRVFRKPALGANGSTLDRDGNLVTCEHRSRVVSVTIGGERRALVEKFGQKRFNSPNDVVVRSDGTVWFTDPPYGIPEPKRQALMEYGGRYVFRFDPRDGSVTPVATDFDMPNGLCFSPDERFLYVADSGAPKHVRRFRVNADGSLEGG